MADSPFHGIFSALQQEGNRKHPKQSASETDDAVVPAAKRAVGQVAVDIYEHENYYIIKAPIAGVRLADLDIEISDNTVTIRGNRAQGDDVSDDQFYVRECFWGPFSRTVTLPVQIDAKRVKATFNKENILKILVPKEDKVKIIPING